MRSRITTFIVFALMLFGASAKASAQQISILQGKDIPSSWGIDSRELFQFSGITPVMSDGQNQVFAVITDKAKGGGIFFLSVLFDRTGSSVSGTGLYPLEGTLASSESRDPEGIVRIGDKFWVSGEADQMILEYDALGYPTGRSLSIPEDMDRQAIRPNLGFEALATDGTTIWTTTENSTRSDHDPGSAPLLKIQGFSESTTLPTRRYLYRMDTPRTRRIPSGSTYVHGVSEMLCLDDGRLAVLEREVDANPKRLRLKSTTKIYIVDPNGQKEGEVLEKTLLRKFSTGLAGLRLTLANYEGMCLVTLADGSRAIMLVNDSQGRMGYSKGKLGVNLSDYVKLIKL